MHNPPNAEEEATRLIPKEPTSAPHTNFASVSLMRAAVFRATVFASMTIMCSRGTIVAFAVYARDMFHVSKQEMAPIFLCYYGMSTFISVILTRVGDSVGFDNALVITTVPTIIGFTIIVFSTNYIIFCLGITLSAASYSTYVLGEAFVSKLSKLSQSLSTTSSSFEFSTQFASTFQLGHVAAYILSSVAFGALIAASLDAPWIVCLCISFMCCIGGYVFLRNLTTNVLNHVETHDDISEDLNADETAIRPVSVAKVIALCVVRFFWAGAASVLSSFYLYFMSNKYGVNIVYTSVQLSATLVVSFVAIAIVRRFHTRFDPNHGLLLGIGCKIAGYFTMYSFTSVHRSEFQLGVTWISIVIIGIGYGIAAPLLTVLLIDSSSKEFMSRVTLVAGLSLVAAHALGPFCFGFVDANMFLFNTLLCAGSLASFVVYLGLRFFPPEAEF